MTMGVWHSIWQRNLNGHIKQMVPLGLPLQREEGKAPATAQPVYRSSSWGTGSSWNPSGSIARPSCSSGRCPICTKCITNTQKTNKKYKKYGSTEDDLWGQRWANCLLPSWVFPDHDWRFGLLCESEGASTKRVFGYDAKYQWDNQNLATIVMQVPKSFQSKLQERSRFPEFYVGNELSMMKSNRRQWALKCKHCDVHLQGMLCQEAKYPGPPMFYHWHGYTSSSTIQMAPQEVHSQLCIRKKLAFKVLSR